MLKEGLRLNPNKKCFVVVAVLRVQQCLGKSKTPQTFAINKQMKKKTKKHTARIVSELEDRKKKKGKGEFPG